MTAPTPGVPGHDITRLPAGWSCSCGDGSGDSRKDEVSREMGIRLHLEDEAWRASLPTLSLPVLLDQYATAQQVRTRIGPKGTTSTRVHGRDRSLLLRAEIDRRIEVLSAAPSGETTPHPCVLCDEDAQETLCPRHLAEFAAHGHQDTEYATICGGYYCSCGSPLPCPLRRAGVAAASVPAAPNAQATPDHLPLSAIRAELDDFTAALAANDALGDGPHADYVVRTSEERMEAAAWELAMKLHDALAAPSGEQPTGPTAELAALRQALVELDEYLFSNDGDTQWLVHEECGVLVTSVSAGDDLAGLHWAAAEHECPKQAGEQPTTEPVGEVPDHG